jgi:hypothetical protein
MNFTACGELAVIGVYFSFFSILYRSRNTTHDDSEHFNQYYYYCSSTTATIDNITIPMACLG